MIIQIEELPTKVTFTIKEEGKGDKYFFADKPLTDASINTFKQIVGLVLEKLK